MSKTRFHTQLALKAEIAELTLQIEQLGKRLEQALADARSAKELAELEGQRADQAETKTRVTNRNLELDNRSLRRQLNEQEADLTVLAHELTAYRSLATVALLMKVLDR
jgi:hypothetical protein